MPKLTHGSDGDVLRVEQEQINVSSALPRPDPDWRYVDQQGHEHYRDNSHPASYPTLVAVVDETYWCEDCGDEHTRSHWECATCGEIIEPGVLDPSTFVEYRPGLRRYFLNDEEISEERASEIVAEQRRAADERG